MKIFMENLIRDAVTYTGKPVLTIAQPNLTTFLYRTRQKKDSHYYRCCVRSQKARHYLVWLWCLDSVVKKIFLSEAAANPVIRTNLSLQFAVYKQYISVIVLL